MTTNPTEILLSRLEGVKETSASRYMARCPAHDDKSPSLSVSAKDGKVLIHCFAGCDASEVMAAVDLSLRDLFESSDDHRQRPVRQRYDYRALLKAALMESQVLLIAGNQIAEGRPLSAVDQRRLCRAVERIESFAEVAE
jgi:hypothetical protein